MSAAVSKKQLEAKGKKQECKKQEVQKDAMHDDQTTAFFVICGFCRLSAGGCVGCRLRLLLLPPLCCYAYYRYIADNHNHAKQRMAPASTPTAVFISWAMCDVLYWLLASG
jgi:hypothetical protein